MKEIVESKLIQSAMENLARGKIIAERCPYRPQYHFSAPAFWMNDPNGPIFYKGEYHLFYQHNPHKIENPWDDLIYWGHAKSKDLVHWEHLPIALAPSLDRGESGCWSGSCINNNGIPTIIYTSVGPKRNPYIDAEQWLAISNDDMITWEKYTDNPIMTLNLHGSLDIRDWRDPYMWKENDTWYMVLGGHEYEPKAVNNKGIVLLYKSKDLINWKFLHVLCRAESRKLGRNWEVPNFCPLGDKHILIVSPHKEVIYNIGTYKNTNFKPGKWRILDHGRCFYAPNTMFDNKGRLILFGWIQGGGIGGWNGCVSLPRVLTLDSDEKLRVMPIAELEMLREKHIKVENITITPQSKHILGKFQDLKLEIRAEIECVSATSFGLKAFQSGENDVGELIEFDTIKKTIRVGQEKGNLESFNQNNPILLHIFIDRSVIEIFINYSECLTARIYPKANISNHFNLFAKKGSIILRSLDLWTIRSI